MFLGPYWSDASINSWIQRKGVFVSGKSSRRSDGLSGTPALRFAMTNEWLCIGSLRATRLGVIKATLVRGFSSRNRTVSKGTKADPHARWCGGCRQQWRRLTDLSDLLNDHLAISNWQHRNREAKFIRKAPFKVQKFLGMGCCIVDHD